MSYTNLTFDERESIEFFINMGLNKEEIAKKLKRHPSTIGREIDRNIHKWYGYQASHAQKKYEKRVFGPKHKPVLDNPQVHVAVENGLKQKQGPHVISGRLKLEKSPVQISTESIYRLVYDDFKKGGSLWKWLPSSSKKRKHRLGRPDQRGVIQDRQFIEKRPASANNRSRYGHWEGDTVIGAHHKGVLFTSMERKSKYMVAWNAGTKQLKKMIHSITNAFQKIPQNIRKSLTVDNGKEFSSHKAFSKATGMDVYFSHPGCPYERGSIENGNRTLRKYFPKGIDLSKVSQWELQKVIHEINHTPRKVLNYLTPWEVLFNNKKIAL